MGLLPAANAQPIIAEDNPAALPIIPKFVPAQSNSPIVSIPPAAPVEIPPRTFTRTQPPLAPSVIAEGIGATQGFVDDVSDIQIRPELPGIERMFMRDSEANFFNRLRQEAKRVPGSGPVIFPTQTPISKEKYTQPSYPRIDPRTKQPIETNICAVEPCYVCHRRLLFEQPNFERAGYNYGILQPGICFGIFIYDLAFLPYHYWSEVHDHGECNVGKTLPGDPYAPLLITPERFSVTGAIGQAAAILGAGFIAP